MVCDSSKNIYGLLLPVQIKYGNISIDMKYRYDSGMAGTVMVPAVLFCYSLLLGAI